LFPFVRCNAVQAASFRVCPVKCSLHFTTKYQPGKVHRLAEGVLECRGSVVGGVEVCLTCVLHNFDSTLQQRGLLRLPLGIFGDLGVLARVQGAHGGGDHAAEGHRSSDNSDDVCRGHRAPTPSRASSATRVASCCPACCLPGHQVASGREADVA